MRIDAALAWAIKELEGGESPSVDANVLLSHILNKSQTYLFTWPDKIISDNDKVRFEHMIARRKNGEPVAYIIGKRDFWTLTLETSSHTLIPRPDTEVLVEQVLHQIIAKHGAYKQVKLRICDLGTGTGAIALALASELPNSNVVGVDVLGEAVLLASRNAASNRIDNAHFVQSDWFGSLGEQQFDVIVSNPPYIDEKSPYLLVGDVRFEPASALTAKDDGLADIKHIIRLAPNYLKPGGLIGFEHGFDQAVKVQTLLHNGGFSQIHSVKDYGDNDRVTVGYLNNPML